MGSAIETRGMNSAKFCTLVRDWLVLVKPSAICAGVGNPPAENLVEPRRLELLTPCMPFK